MYRLASLLVLVCFVATPALAQSGGSHAAENADDRPVDGPNAPVAPSTISRDDHGKATVRALELDTPLTVDGHLKERSILI